MAANSDELARTGASTGKDSTSVRGGLFVILQTDRDGNRLSRLVDIFLIAMITLSVVAVVLESVPRLEQRFDAIFYWLEVFTVGVFTVEYVLRVWTSIEADGRSLRGWTAFKCRLRFMATPYAIIDLIAILPFYLV
ncbi:MAG: ion transporter, partial [Gammaproteobacteria bacterium]|nr:ion transporter [Gammaproteobacteria bacterium]